MSLNCHHWFMQTGKQFFPSAALHHIWRVWSQNVINPILYGFCLFFGFFFKTGNLSVFLAFSFSIYCFLQNTLNSGSVMKLDVLHLMKKIPLSCNHKKLDYYNMHVSLIFCFNVTFYEQAPSCFWYSKDRNYIF